MKGLAAGLICLVCSLSSAGAQEPDEPEGAVYKALQLHRFGHLEGNLDGRIYRMSDGVKMTLIAERSEDNLDVEAETVNFTYDEDGGKSPTQIVFEQNVVFVQGDSTVRADKVTIDLQTKEALFTGNPSADLPGIRGAEVEFIRINLDTGDLVAGGPGKVRKIPLQSEEDVDDSTVSDAQN